MKTFKQFNESIKDLLQGPSDEELLDNFKDLNPDELLDKSLKINFQKGIDVALERGADKSILDNYNEMKDWFIDLITDMEEFKSDKRSDSVFWKKNGAILFKQNFEKCYLSVDYESIWSVFKDKYGYDYAYTKSFIENQIEETLNWNGLTPLVRVLSPQRPIEETLNDR